MKQSKYIVPVVFGVLFIGFICFYFISPGKDISTEEIIEEEIVVVPDTLRLIFIGDVMVHSTQYNAAWYEGGDTTYNFVPTFQYVKDYISSTDLSMANLEVPFGGKPYSGYPMFSSPTEIADALKDTGFDLMFTANNHVADKGSKGIEGTLDYLEKLGLLYTGSFKDSASKAANYPLIVEINNIRLSLLNYTYDTNGMPVRKPNMVNLIDTLQIRADLEKAKNQNTDYIITCMHWGYEYHRTEHAEQRELAHFLAENGSDLILGAHPHVVQPYDEIITYRGDTVPVIYSVGNFVSNQQWRYADGGIAFEIKLVKENDKTTRISTGYEPLWVNRFNDHIRSIYRVIPVNDYCRDSAKYDLNNEQIRKMTLFYEDTKATLKNLPFTGYYDGTAK